MPTRRYIILRDADAPAVARNMVKVAAKADGKRERQEFHLDAADLSPREAGDLQRDPSLVALAPSVPMKLHEPLWRAAAAVGGKQSWGIEATGSDKSPHDGAAVTIAVLDTGIDAAHPAFAHLAGRILVRDFTGEGDRDENGHGTHCAGTIFGGDVEKMRIGIARGVGRALVGKVLGKGGGNSDQLVQAIEWAADQGANIISMSLGIDYPGLVKDYIDLGHPAEFATSKALEGYRKTIDLFGSLVCYLEKRATSRGTFLVVVAAAGNESRMADNPDYEVTVSPPAASMGILSVAALEQRDGVFHVAPYSNTGARIAAPGSNIISAAAGGKLAMMSGTSMAAPHVAGVAALWAQHLTRERGKFNTTLLTERICGNAMMQGIADNALRHHVGAGIVQAPL